MLRSNRLKKGHFLNLQCPLCKSPSARTAPFNSIQFNLLRKLKQPTENEVVSEGLAALRNHYGSCMVLATALQLPVMISEPPKPPSQLWHTLDVQRCKSI